MDQLTLREKIGVNYTLLELSGAINASTFDELQEKAFSTVRIKMIPEMIMEIKLIQITTNYELTVVIRNCHILLLRLL